jgi:hypothetical protein
MFLALFGMVGCLSSAFAVEGSGSIMRRYLNERDEINRRYNAQMKEEGAKFSAALYNHTVTRGRYPDTSRFAAIGKQQSSEMSALENRYMSERNKARPDQIKEFTKALTRKETSNEMFGPKKLLNKLRKLAKAGGGKSGGGASGPGAGGQAAGRGTTRPAATDTGPSQPETVLDGSGIPKELEFPGRKPAPAKKGK